VIGLVITSPLSLARVLWWYGEDALWPRALELTPVEVARLAPAFARFRNLPELVARTWPSAPAGAYLLLPTIGLLEGAVRPAARRQRRATSLMPSVLDVDEDARWKDPQLLEVCRVVDELSGSRSFGPPPWDRPRLRGRWAFW